MQIRTNVSSGNKEKSKNINKGKQMNIYSTMNGDSKKHIKKENKAPKIDQDTINDDYIKIGQEGVFADTTRLDSTPA